MIYVLIFILFIATPAMAQLSPPQTGRMAQQALTFYRIGFVSKSKKLSIRDGQALINSIKGEPIEDKYIFRLKKSPDGTYEIEMLMKIIFLDKHEAELAIKYLEDNPNFCTEVFDTEIVECQA